MAKRLWVLLGLLAMAPAFGAELKIGYVNAARLMDESPQAVEVSKRFLEEFSGKESELQAGQKKLKQMGELFVRVGVVLCVGVCCLLVCVMVAFLCVLCCSV